MSLTKKLDRFPSNSEEEVEDELQRNIKYGIDSDDNLLVFKLYVLVT